MAKKTNFKKLAVLGLLGFAAFKLLGKKKDQPSTGGGTNVNELTPLNNNSPTGSGTTSGETTSGNTGGTNTGGSGAEMVGLGGWKRKR